MRRPRKATLSIPGIVSAAGEEAIFHPGDHVRISTRSPWQKQQQFEPREQPRDVRSAVTAVGTESCGVAGIDGGAIAEAVQRPTMQVVATKTVEQLDVQALHRVRERLVGPR
jgi:hypothetical protein